MSQHSADWAVIIYWLFCGVSAFTMLITLKVVLFDVEMFSIVKHASIHTAKHKLQPPKFCYIEHITGKWTFQDSKKQFYFSTSSFDHFSREKFSTKTKLSCTKETQKLKRKFNVFSSKTTWSTDIYLADQLLLSLVNCGIFVKSLRCVDQFVQILTLGLLVCQYV